MARDVINPYSFRPAPELTGPETAARAGIDYETARRLWRALGLPDVPEDEVHFDDGDVDALRSINDMSQRGIGIEDLLSIARSYGRGFSAISDAETRAFARTIVVPLIQQGTDLEDIETRLQPLVQWLLETTARLLDYAHRRHLTIALQGVTVGETSGTTETVAVAFIDLVDFSAVSGRLAGDELGELVQRFEDLAISVAADRAVRVVKVIGDAVMLASRAPAAVVQACEEILEGVAADPSLPRARAGASIGEVVTLGGDYFGHTVNIAARITGFARPGTLVISDELLTALGDAAPDVSKIGAEKLKGVGRVRLFKLRPHDEP